MWVKKFILGKKKLANDLLDTLKKPMEKSLDNLLDEIDLISPVDEWDYKRGHTNEWVTLQEDKIIWIISNESENAEKVEFWFWPWWKIWWRETEVVWHPAKWPTFVWRWAKVYARAVDSTKRKILNNFK